MTGSCWDSEYFGFDIQSFNCAAVYTPPPPEPEPEPTPTRVLDFSAFHLKKHRKHFSAEKRKDGIRWPYRS